ncbi:MAG: excinuclease subunit [Patescibacteria group bacterium]|jgi:excinuclease ABC subunit A|nr:excinuclease subunit [Patescibacteria group bacterium]
MKKQEFEAGKIVVRGAKTHNLKNISVEMPRNKMVVFTGLSGSGKSSLAFDTIFAEGQRRYVESLSSYARQFLSQMPKPDVDEITGLSPAISIDQKSRSNNPRSTVATITEIYDYLRVLYARIGRPYSPISGKEIKKLSNQEISEFVKNKIRGLKNSPNKKEVMGVEYTEDSVHIYSPVVRGRKGEYYQMLYDFLGKGYSKVRVDGAVKNLRDSITLSKTKKHEIDLLIDSFSFSEAINSSEDFDMRLSEAIERAINESDGFIRIVVSDFHNKGEDLENILLSAKLICPDDGYTFPEIEPRLFSFNSPYGACPDCNGLGTKNFFGDEICDTCGGARLREEALNVFLGDRSKGMNIVKFTDQSIKDAYDFITSLKLSKKETEISVSVIKEIEDRLKFMLNVGLDYLTLDRKASTLSGGESQRIRLASQLGSRLVGALYVLDEPTIGLHQRDNDRLIKTLEDLRDLGNTIIVVEHDEDTIYASDYIVDIGPKAGVHGGQIVVADYLDKLLSGKEDKSGSRTISYLREEEVIPLPEKRRDTNKGWIKIKGAKVFNIKNINAEIPLGRMTAITGVSGSGKSSFLYEVLHKNLQARFERKYRSAKTFNCAEFSGTENLSRAILIDQSPIGRTPRSNLATYTGAWGHIRDMFAATDEARFRGWKANRFSFNVKGGRCEACEGKGLQAVEMHFLPTVYVTCDVCDGKRFDKETLKVKYKGKNVYEVLRMTVEEGIEFFGDIPAIYDRLKTLSDVGLGYLEIGQPATTLSGGEAQRVKISSELYRPMTERTIYLLDEPTVGLHYDDVANLISVLDKLVQKGNTVVVIEHNLDLIKVVDYIVDLGPEGGQNGGRVIAKGTPEEVADNEKSFTGQYLRKTLLKTKRAMKKIKK